MNKGIAHFMVRAPAPCGIDNQLSDEAGAEDLKGSYRKDHKHAIKRMGMESVLQTLDEQVGAH